MRSMKSQLKLKGVEREKTSFGKSITTKHIVKTIFTGLGKTRAPKKGEKAIIGAIRAAARKQRAVTEKTERLGSVVERKKRFT